jgi:RNA polymerase sigma-70 factor (ECF subfamily)
VEERFTETAIKDDQLRMMFSCCHPRLSEESQVMLILHILCGFSVDEVAKAFVTTYAAVEKRISRAKKVLAGSKRLFDTEVSADFSGRLPAVQRALYLLFNEGYHGASAESPVRAEPCQESRRLARLLLDEPQGATPATYALLALMSLNAARLPARVDASSGDLTPLREQDRSKWDQKLASEGIRFLELAASGPDVTDYHVEAAIASVHARAGRFEDTDWDQIVFLYDMLMGIHPSPIVALNRAIAIAERNGPERGLEEIHAIAEQDRMRSYPFYEAALGELELRRGRHDVASDHFVAAVGAARNEMERRFLQQRLNASKHARSG